MKKPIAISGILLVMGLALASGANAQQRRGPRAAGRIMASGRLLTMLDNPRVRAALRLTDGQAAKLRQIIVTEEKASIRAHAEMAIQAINLKELLRENSPARGAVMQTVTALGRVRTQLMQDRIDALLQAKTVLTPEQQQQIRSFIERRRMRRGPMAGRGMRMNRGEMMQRGGMMGGGMMGGSNKSQPTPPPSN